MRRALTRHSFAVAVNNTPTWSAPYRGAGSIDPRHIAALVPRTKERLPRTAHDNCVQRGKIEIEEVSCVQMQIRHLFVDPPFHSFPFGVPVVPYRPRAQILQAGSCEKYT